MKMRTLLYTFCFFFMTSASVLAADEAKKLVTVVDYIGGDYKNAVQAGKGISQEEYREMKEFSLRSLELASQLKKTAERHDIEQNLKRTPRIVNRKGTRREALRATDATKNDCTRT